MKAVLALAVGAAAKTTWTDLRDAPYSYAQWLAEFKPAQPGTEAVFNANLAAIKAHNAKGLSWKEGVNAFTGMTRAEFKAARLQGYKSRHAWGSAARDLATPAPLDLHRPVADLPASVDWRTKGAVTPVKDQGGCGGCWSFSAAETAESMVQIATGQLMVFSEQQILSCSKNPLQCGGTGGCSGATQEIAFNYSRDAGLTLEKDYPYRGTTGKCDAAKVKPAAHIKGYVFLPPNNYTALMNAVATIGPMAISAAAEPWQSYETGVFQGTSADVDHAIQLVGYGTDATLPAAEADYWLVRNSWSEGWGEKGYIRVGRKGSSSPAGEPCLKDNTPSDGDGCTGGAASIEVCGLCGILSDTSYPIGASL